MRTTTSRVQNSQFSVPRTFAFVMLAVAWLAMANGCAAIVGGLAGAGTGYIAGHEAGERAAEKEIDRSEK